jgi:putative ABC transport system ATP-binding protein
LSGGQQQRVAIARSLVAGPSIILADEPTGNLDSRTSHIVMDELSDIHGAGNTIIMVTHNPALLSHATRVINMLDGRIDTDEKMVADHDLPSPSDSETVVVRLGGKPKIAPKIEIKKVKTVKKAVPNSLATSEKVAVKKKTTKKKGGGKKK